MPEPLAGDIGTSLVGRPCQQAHRRQRGLAQRHVGEFVVIALGVGLPKRGCHRESRAVDGAHRPVGNELLQHRQGRRNVNTHQARLTVAVGILLDRDDEVVAVSGDTGDHRGVELSNASLSTGTSSTGGGAAAIPAAQQMCYCAASSNSSSDSRSNDGRTSTSLIASRSALIPK